jgi:hypothetical protein
MRTPNPAIVASTLLCVVPAMLRTEHGCKGFRCVSAGVAFALVRLTESKLELPRFPRHRPLLWSKAREKRLGVQSELLLKLANQARCFHLVQINLSPAYLSPNWSERH